jgi:hypothetical protein
MVAACSHVCVFPVFVLSNVGEDFKMSLIQGALLKYIVSELILHWNRPDGPVH